MLNIKVSSFVKSANVRARKPNSGKSSTSSGVGRISPDLNFTVTSKKHPVTGETYLSNSYTISKDFMDKANLQNTVNEAGDIVEKGNSISYDSGYVLVTKHDSPLVLSLKSNVKSKKGLKSNKFSSVIFDYQLHSIGLLPETNKTLEDIAGVTGVDDNGTGFKDFQAIVYTDKIGKDEGKYTLELVEDELQPELVESGVVAAYKVVEFDKEAIKAELLAEKEENSTSEAPADVATEAPAQGLAEAPAEMEDADAWE